MKVKQSFELVKKAIKIDTMFRNLSADKYIHEDFFITHETATSDSVFPLEASLKNKMEQLFDADFSNVKIHVGKEAADLARNAGALAFTIGSSIYFASGKYAPDTQEGQKLLAHELTHIVQITKGSRMVYLEDIDQLEEESEQIEGILGGKYLEQLESSSLTLDADFKRYGQGYSGGDRKFGLNKSSRGGGGAGKQSVTSFANANSGVIIRYLMSGGEELFLSQAEYQALIDTVKEKFTEELEEELRTLPEEKCSEKILQICRWAKEMI